MDDQIKELLVKKFSFDVEFSGFGSKHTAKLNKTAEHLKNKVVIVRGELVGSRAIPGTMVPRDFPIPAGGTPEKTWVVAWKIRAGKKN